MNPSDLGVDVSQNVKLYRINLLPSLDEYLNYLLNQEREFINRAEGSNNNNRVEVKATESKETQTDLTFAATSRYQDGDIFTMVRAARKEHEEDAVSLISFETCKSTHKSQVRNETTVYMNHKEFYWDIHIKDEKLLYESNFFTFLNLMWRLVFMLDKNSKHHLKLVCVTNDANIVEPIIIKQCQCRIHSLLKPLNVKLFNNLMFSALPKTDISNAGCNVNKQFIIDFTSADNINSYIENEKLKISVSLAN